MTINTVRKIDGPVFVRHVLVSVSDKRGLDTFIPELLASAPDAAIFSTGGTYGELSKILGREGAHRLVPVSEYTGQPETQGGLVKTLDFKIYLGLLTETYNEAHAKDMERTGAVPIDMAVVNLYPFAETVAKKGVSVEEARGQIDIGGPAMIRAAAKNFLRVAAVVDPSDYPEIISELKALGGKIGLQTRFRLAQKAFRHTAAYDRAIGDYMTAASFDKAAECYEVTAS
jgi:phosphoribosylaminoimidazolecarboxamide formyltransferase/IMP cyclohydrolase